MTTPGGHNPYAPYAQNPGDEGGHGNPGGSNRSNDPQYSPYAGWSGPQPQQHAQHTMAYGQGPQGNWPFGYEGQFASGEFGPGHYTQSPPSRPRKLNGGVIVGVIAALLAVLLLVLGAVLFVRGMGGDDGEPTGPDPRTLSATQQHLHRLRHPDTSTPLSDDVVAKMFKGDRLATCDGGKEFFDSVGITPQDPAGSFHDVDCDGWFQSDVSEVRIIMVLDGKLEVSGGVPVLDTETDSETDPSTDAAADPGSQPDKFSGWSYERGEHTHNGFPVPCTLSSDKPEFKGLAVQVGGPCTAAYPLLIQLNNLLSQHKAQQVGGETAFTDPDPGSIRLVDNAFYEQLNGAKAIHEGAELSGDKGSNHADGGKLTLVRAKVHPNVRDSETGEKYVRLCVTARFEPHPGADTVEPPPLILRTPVSGDLELTVDELFRAAPGSDAIQGEYCSRVEAYPTRGRNVLVSPTHDKGSATTPEDTEAIWTFLTGFQAEVLP